MKTIYNIPTHQLTDLFTKHPHTIPVIVFGRLFQSAPLFLGLAFSYDAFTLIHLEDPFIQTNLQLSWVDEG